MTSVAGPKLGDDLTFDTGHKMTAVTHSISIVPASYGNNIDTGLVKKTPEQTLPVNDISQKLQALQNKVEGVLHMIELVHEALDLEDAIESTGGDEVDASEIEPGAAEQDSNVDPDGRNGGGHSGQDQAEGEEQDTQDKDKQISGKPGARNKRAAQQYTSDMSKWLGGAEEFVDVSQKILRSPRTFSSPSFFASPSASPPGSSVGPGPTDEEMWWVTDKDKKTVNYQRETNPDLLFATLTAEFTRFIDQALLLQLADQKSKNARIADYNTMMEKMREISAKAGEDGTINDSEYDVIVEPHPSSEMHDLMKEEADSRKTAAMEKLKNNPGYAALVNISGVGEPTYFYESEGEIWGYWPGTDANGNESSKKEDGAWWYPLARSPNESIKADVLALSKVNRAQITLRDMMSKYDLGTLPKDGKTAKVMLETMKGRVDTESAQLQLDMVRLQKLNGNRNEGYTQLANNNKQASDTKSGIMSKT